MLCMKYTNQLSLGYASQWRAWSHSARRPRLGNFNSILTTLPLCVSASWLLPHSLWLSQHALAEISPYPSTLFRVPRLELAFRGTLPLHNHDSGLRPRISAPSQRLDSPMTRLPKRTTHLQRAMLQNPRTRFPKQQLLRPRQMTSTSQVMKLHRKRTPKPMRSQA